MRRRAHAEARAHTEARAHAQARTHAAGADAQQLPARRHARTHLYIQAWRAIGARAHEHGATYLVDSMSAFGAEPVCLDDVDFLVSSANKAIEGVPGFAFVLARRTALKRAEGS